MEKPAGRTTGDTGLPSNRFRRGGRWGGGGGRGRRGWRTGAEEAGSGPMCLSRFYKSIKRGISDWVKYCCCPSLNFKHAHAFIAHYACIMEEGYTCSPFGLPRRCQGAAAAGGRDADLWAVGSLIVSGKEVYRMLWFWSVCYGVVVSSVESGRWSFANVLGLVKVLVLFLKKLEGILIPIWVEKDPGEGWYFGVLVGFWKSMLRGWNLGMFVENMEVSLWQGGDWI